MIGFKPQKNITSRFLNQECNIVWKIIEGCKTIDDTRDAQIAVNLYSTHNKSDIDKQIIHYMREELYDMSYNMFKKLKKSKKLL